MRTVNPIDFNTIVVKLRKFFTSRGFIELDTQSYRSTLTVCKNPDTICTYHSDTIPYPLPQTGQVLLDNMLLDNPSINGCFGITTRYINNQCFPIFEFGSKGNMANMINLENALLQNLGFSCGQNKIQRNNGLSSEGPIIFHGLMGEYGRMINRGIDYDDCLQYDAYLHNQTRRISTNSGNYDKSFQQYKDVDYNDIIQTLGVNRIGKKEQNILGKKNKILFIKNFPHDNEVFWNVKVSENIAKKVDVILYGEKVIGSYEKSCDKEQMKDMFSRMYEGKYMKTLYDNYGKERVDRDFEEFIDREHYPRYGGSIGIDRISRAMKMGNLVTA